MPPPSTRSIPGMSTVSESASRTPLSARRHLRCSTTSTAPHGAPSRRRPTLSGWPRRRASSPSRRSATRRRSAMRRSTSARRSTPSQRCASPRARRCTRIYTKAGRWRSPSTLPARRRSSSRTRAAPMRGRASGVRCSRRVTMSATSTTRWSVLARRARTRSSPSRICTALSQPSRWRPGLTIC